MKTYVIILELSDGIHLDKVFLNQNKAYKYFKKIVSERNDLSENHGNIVIFDNDDAYYLFEKEIEQ